MSDWRDPSPSKCERCGREWPTERLQLVERLITAEKQVRELQSVLARYPVAARESDGFSLDGMLERWKDEGVAGVRAELVEQGIAITRRKSREVIECLDLDPAEVRALVLDRQTLTVVRRDGRSVRLLIMEDQ